MGGNDESSIPVAAFLKLWLEEEVRMECRDTPDDALEEVEELLEERSRPPRDIADCSSRSACVLVVDTSGLGAGHGWTVSLRRGKRLPGLGGTLGGVRPETELRRDTLEAWRMFGGACCEGPPIGECRGMPEVAEGLPTLPLLLLLLLLPLLGLGPRSSLVKVPWRTIPGVLSTADAGL